jgi:hypothetical protein
MISGDDFNRNMDLALKLGPTILSVWPNKPQNLARTLTMTIFIAYSFKDQWISQSIFPLTEALGFNVESGRDMAGQPIDEGARRKIEGCDGLVAFLTRVTPIEGSSGRFKTSDWVIQEYTHAAARGLLVLQVRESGVDFHGQLAGNRQWIDLDPDDRLPAAVQLCRALRDWQRGIDIELRLRTPSFVEAIRGRLTDRKYRCSYLLRHRDGREMANISSVQIFPRSGGLFVYARNVPRDAFIELRVEFGDQTWTSLGREVQTIDIDLERD